MQSTPQSQRTHIGLFGHTNAGKSALLNALAGSELSIVSAQAGTTTDPVVKASELIPYGPVVWIDTAGLGDYSELGALRLNKTFKELERCDFALYLIDSSESEAQQERQIAAYHDFTKKLEQHRTPHLLILSKADLAAPERLAELGQRFPEAFILSTHKQQDISSLRTALAAKLSVSVEKEASLIAGLFQEGELLLLVTPIDSAAPAGRLILPQVQLIRACLDEGLRCLVTQPAQLAQTLKEIANIRMVVCDSQAFSEVAALVPENIPLTSFSMLSARQKGDLRVLVQGAAAIKTLPENACILIAESCSHNQTHEDIGRVKLPAALRKKSGKTLHFDWVTGRDFPTDLSAYALVVHCGACMTTAKALGTRIEQALGQNIPITNYGVALACCGGILERAAAALGVEVQV